MNWNYGTRLYRFVAQHIILSCYFTSFLKVIKERFAPARITQQQKPQEGLAACVLSETYKETQHIK
jgi:hypothetical protein